MNRGIDFIVDHYKLVLVFLLAFTLPFAYYYSKQNYYNNIGIFFEKNDPDIDYYKSFQKTFGNEESVAIVFKTADIFTIDTLKMIRAITDAAYLVQGVQSVYSLTNSEIVNGENDTLDFKMLIPKGEITQEVVSLAKQNANHYRSIVNTLISKDGKTTAIIAELKPAFSNNEKKLVVKQLMAETTKAVDGEISLHYAGAPCLDVEINELTYRDNIRFTPITFFLVFLVISVLLNNITLSFLCLINIMMIVVWCVGFLILKGESINTVTLVIAPLLLAISTSDSIHILSYYKKLYQKNGKNTVNAISESVKSLWLPCLFTSMTTAIAYFSFIVTNVRPVKIVGIFTGVGIIIAFLMSMIFLPALIIAFGRFNAKNNLKQIEFTENFDEKRKNSFFEKFGLFIVNHYKIISLFFLLITLLAAFGISKIRFETDFASYLKDSNNVKQDMHFVEKNIRGTIPVELVITALSKDDDFTHPQSMQMIEGLQREIMQYMKGRYSSSYSVADYLKTSHKAFNGGKEEFYILPDKGIDLVDYQEFCDEKIMSKYLSPDRMETRISFTSYFGSTDVHRKLEHYLESDVKKYLGEKYLCKFTGISALYTKMDTNLCISQINSFFAAFILIFIMMIFVCQSIKFAIISMAPNLFPVFLTLGIMGWAGIPLDVSTIMIASITIGIAVDDTIHFIIGFRRNRSTGIEIRDSILKTYQDTGKPIIMTSVILCIAYLILISGSVKPIISFGAFAGLAMVFALIGDLCILPAIIMLFKPAVKE